MKLSHDHVRCRPFELGELSYDDIMVLVQLSYRNHRFSYAKADDTSYLYGSSWRSNKFHYNKMIRNTTNYLIQLHVRGNKLTVR
jgi:hypothetical protein